MNLIPKTLAAVATLIAATIVSLTPNQPTHIVPTPAPITATSTAVPAEGDPGWDCAQRTEHSNGVCGHELPSNFTACVQASGYDVCLDAVRESLGR